MRGATMRAHKGQMSLPGGKQDGESETLEQCASREAQEEIGLDPSSYQILGRLSKVWSYPSKSWVTPIVALSKTPLEPKITSPGEVQSIHYLHLSSILYNSFRTHCTVCKYFSPASGGAVSFPAFFTNGGGGGNKDHSSESSAAAAAAEASPSSTLHQELHPSHRQHGAEPVGLISLQPVQRGGHGPIIKSRLKKVKATFVPSYFEAVDNMMKAKEEAFFKMGGSAQDLQHHHHQTGTTTSTDTATSDKEQGGDEEKELYPPFIHSRPVPLEHALPPGEQMVWGLTAFILCEFLCKVSAVIGVDMVSSNRCIDDPDLENQERRERERKEARERSRKKEGGGKGQRSPTSRRQRGGGGSSSSGGGTIEKVEQEEEEQNSSAPLLSKL